MFIRLVITVRLPIAFPISRDTLRVIASTLELAFSALGKTRLTITSQLKVVRTRACLRSSSQCNKTQVTTSSIVVLAEVGNFARKNM